MNDSMGKYVTSEVVKLMIQNDVKVKGANILVLGITFKENCPDVRNTKAVDVINNLKGYGTKIDIYDPWASPEDVMHEYGIKTSTTLPSKKYDAIVLTVSHKEFLDLDLNNFIKKEGVIYDVKGVLDMKNVKKL